ncbi:YbcC family protein [Archangium lansingense]|uniref:Probable inorganic carbon transporter subunit DabA n=1 Tax=Archangium lansingense TaxID=2995310 RepID=A0ABT3ZXZ2_9BACT|nr:DUF2309 domain-containing protein [Archangium lansinium]MCY1074265.1 DUF2309 domain-containing protein [Archangium lansinium]
MSHPRTSPHGTPADRGQHLREVLAHTAHLLPVQGPISVFVHHNTLHAFQHQPFHEAVEAASAVFGTEGYLPEARYRELYRNGRITAEDLEAALAERHAGAPVDELSPGSLTRLEVERLALRHAMPVETPASLRWKMTEQTSSRRLRPDVPEAARARLLQRSTAGLRTWLERVGKDWTMNDLAAALLGPAWKSADPKAVTRELAAAFGGNGSLPSLRERLAKELEAFAVSALWAACQQPLLVPEPSRAQEATAPEAVRSHREVLRDVTGEDPADLVHPHLIRACAAFLDEGVSHWPMPERERGLYAAWRALKLRGSGVLPHWLEGLTEELTEAERQGTTSEQAVLTALDTLGVPAEQWEGYLTRVLQALPGWAGMVNRLEHTPADRPEGAPPASLMDFLAVRLALELYALRDVARRRLDYTGPLSGLLAHVRSTPPRQATQERPQEEGSWRFFQLAQLASLSALDVTELPLSRRRALLGWLESFDEKSRRRVWQEAYEHHYRMEVLHGLDQNRRRPESLRTVRNARFQVFFCLDDREEGIRRHFEELSPVHDTFGVAGFYGVAMDYRGLDDASHASLCPVVVTPAHEVVEHPHPEHEHLAQARARVRALWARFDHWLHGGAHSLELGWLLTPLVGLLSALLLPLHVVFPHQVDRMRRALAARMVPQPRTRLASLRDESQPTPAVGKARGFSLAEKADRVANLLENVGLVEGFAPLVVLLGHGAVSVNNPHMSAYDCGACGGRHGGANARLFAEMANRPEVRALLRERGIHIPAGTWFIGGMHNTTTDEVVLYDTEEVPRALRGELDELRRAMDEARALSAHERCRRFESAPARLSPRAALRHVEERAVDLSQARPELGHVTNASCIVGRRALTRGLFLDRRAFLVSYDPARDATGAILERILLAVGPVGAGINLEYYFSCVDNDRYGCGTKLPHNLTSLLGVMDGVESDLRTGLPRQMIEIHEPMRLLVVVEASVATLSAIYERQAPIRELVGNGWIQLVSVDPETGAMSRFTPQGFRPVAPPSEQLPVVATSPDWYSGQRDFLSPALIQSLSSPQGDSNHAAQ